MDCERDPQSAGPAGIVFNIQRFSLHDGPGIRSTVFLKGCGLRCSWCANPESQSLEPEVLPRVSLCIGCKRCAKVCPKDAISFPENRCRIDRALCDDCAKCVEACPSRALEIAGERMTVRAVMDVLIRDRSYYRRTGGGVTLSGGEPLLQPEFSDALLAEAKRKGIHTALDTCGFPDGDALIDLASCADLVLFDLKHMDGDAHRKETGQSNEKILANLERMMEKTAAPVWIRYPLIPGFNDSDDAIESLCRHLSSLPRAVEKISLLPFHNLAAAKYAGLGIDYRWKETAAPTKERVESCGKLIEKHGFRVDISR